jgi:predicted transcriptional regulator
MENGNAEAKYSTVYRVWETLQRAESNTEDTAADLCTENIEWVTTDQTGRTAKDLMTDNAFSQVPVQEADSMRSVGSVTDQLLMDVEEIDQPINELMADPFSEIHPETSRSTVIQLLREGDDAVLIQATDGQGYLGIVTPADVI